MHLMLWATSVVQCSVHKQTFTLNSLHNATCFGHFWVEEIHDFRLPSRCKWDLRSSGLLHSVNWQLLTDMSRETVGHVQAKSIPRKMLDYWRRNRWVVPKRR